MKLKTLLSKVWDWWDAGNLESPLQLKCSIAGSSLITPWSSNNTRPSDRRFSYQVEGVGTRLISCSSLACRLRLGENCALEDRSASPFRVPCSCLWGHWQWFQAPGQDTAAGAVLQGHSGTHTWGLTAHGLPVYQSSGSSTRRDRTGHWWCHSYQGTLVKFKHEACQAIWQFFQKVSLQSIPTYTNVFLGMVRILDLHRYKHIAMKLYIQSLQRPEKQ